MTPLARLPFVLASLALGVSACADGEAEPLEAAALAPPTLPDAAPAAGQAAVEEVDTGFPDTADPVTAGRTLLNGFDVPLCRVETSPCGEEGFLERLPAGARLAPGAELPLAGARCQDLFVESCDGTVFAMVTIVPGPASTGLVRLE